MIGASPVGSVLVGRYELVRRIARGGMGEVYEARDRQLERRVAVKVFRGASAVDRGRFDAEVVVLAGLNHPGLVRVYDAGDQDGDAFVVLDLIDGPTLAARLAEGGPPSPVEVAELGAQLADALAYVHAHGVVHRDVTPSNVLCGPDGRPRLADFGIARLVDTTRVTVAATTVGTAAYMAPEQVEGRDVTPAADIYALGLVLLELLTGRKGFAGSQQEVAVGRLIRDPDTTTGVPGEWGQLLAVMTDRAAPNRPSAAEVRDRLEAIRLGASDTPGIGLTETSAAADAPDGTASVLDSTALTTAVPADGTAVMPAALVPRVEHQPRRGRRALLAAMVGLLLLLGVLAFGSGRGSEVEKRSTSGEPVTSSSTTITVAPTTTATPTTAAADGRGKGNGKGRKSRSG